MTASILDKFTDTYNAANPNVARVTSTRSAGATSLSCDNLAGWPTTTSKVHFSTYRLNTSNAVVSGTQIDWSGIVSGNTIGSLTRITGATDNGSAIGDVVVMNPTASWGHDLYTGLAVSHNNDGTMKTSLALTTPVISSAALTTPKVITSLNDTNGNELFGVTATTSAVNEFTVANAATGNGPTLSATGGDTNIDINFSPKGTGKLKGVVNNLFNPYKFSAYRNSAWTVAVGNAKVAFDTELYDTGNNFDSTTNNRFVAPIAGFYHFSSTVNFTPTSGDAFGINIYKNGTIIKSGTSFVIGTTFSSTFVVTCDLQLAATDYVEVYTFNGSGTTKTGGTGAPYTFFDGHLVSAT